MLVPMGGAMQMVVVMLMTVAMMMANDGHYDPGNDNTANATTTITMKITIRVCRIILKS